LNQKFSVTEWQVSAPEPIKMAIEKRLQDMESHDFLHTRPALLRSRWLQQIPDMQDVQIVRLLPHSLQVQAVARVAAAIWQDEQGRLHLFDTHGQVYRPLARGESPDLPLLRVHEEQLSVVHGLLLALSQPDVDRVRSLSEIYAGDGYWRLYFTRGVAWMLPQRDEQKLVTAVSSLLAQPRWRQGVWSVDARIESRWFIRPAGHGSVI